MQAIAAAGEDAAIVGSAIAVIIEELTPDRDRMVEALQVYVTRIQGSLEPGSEIGSDFRSEGEPEERIP